MSKNNNLRANAAQAIYLVLEEGQSLNTALASLPKNINPKDAALTQEICFGVMRVLPQLEFMIKKLMNKPLTKKNRVLHYLLMVGMYQLMYTRVPEHAAVGETVAAATSLSKNDLKKLVNGVLREFQRQQLYLTVDFKREGDASLHPKWLLHRLQKAYPHWKNIVEVNNQKPPMWLRVNQQHNTTEAYLALLQEKEIEAVADENTPYAIRLTHPVSVTQLPGFNEGWISVQDLSAQYAAHLLKPQNGEQILDLCAAPGGKTTHILEMAPEAHVLAVDVDEQRIKRIKENLTRQQQTAEVKVGDGRHPEQWCAGMQFDRILLDAPCSATGIIRRHPDIKWLRRESDIAGLIQLQYEIITSIWPYLKSGGTMVYATCSILPDENKSRIKRFMLEHADAILEMSQQYFPTENGGDGFYYAVLKKK